MNIVAEYYRPLTAEEKAVIEDDSTEFESFNDVTVGNPLFLDIDCGCKCERDSEYGRREYLVIKEKGGKMYLTASRYVMEKFPLLGFNAHAKVARIKSKTTTHEYLNIFKA